MTNVKISSNYVEFINSGTNFGRITGTSDGLMTLNSNAGNVSLTGIGTLTGLTTLSLASGTGSEIDITAGDGSASTGGSVDINAGSGDGANAGGSVTIDGGAGGTTGNGGTVVLTSGAGGSTSGNSGNIIIQPGSVTSGTVGTINLNGTVVTLTCNDIDAPVDTDLTINAPNATGTDIDGHSITLTAGNGSATNSNGGNVNITPGTGAGTGINGILNVNSLVISQGSIYAQYLKTSNVTVNNVTLTTITTWESKTNTPDYIEEFSTPGYIQVKQDGVYLITVSADWVNATYPNSGCEMWVNVGNNVVPPDTKRYAYQSNRDSSNFPPRMTGVHVIPLLANDVISFNVYHASGASRSLVGDPNYDAASLTVVKLV